MRILQVCPRFHDSVASGSTMVAYQISKELVDKGNDVTVYTSDMKDKYTRLKDKIIKIEGINVNRFYSIGTVLTRELKIFVTPSIITKVKAELRSIDVIHLHEYRSFQNIVIHHYAKKYGVPYVLQAHGTLPRIMTKKRLKWIYDIFFGYRILSDSSKVIALNKTEAEQYRDMYVPDEKIEIIPNGIKLSEYNYLPPRGSFRKKFKIGDNDKIILFLGRIHRIKGLDILIMAFTRIIEKLDDVKVMIVGPDSGHLGELQTLVKDLGVGMKVIFTGPLYGVNKLEAYVDADVCVLPSRYEIFGISVLEAYSCGKPVIASRVGGLKDLVIDGITGLLFTIENTGQLARSLFFILEDNIRAKKMGLKGKQFVKKNFNIENIVDQFVILYKEIATLVNE